MDAEPRQLSPEDGARYVQALQAGDLLTVKSLVKEFGKEVQLSLHTVSQDGAGETLSEDVYGTPLAVAAWLEKEAIAVYLAIEGAKPNSYTYESEGWWGWDSCSVQVIEKALVSNMPVLVRALLESPHLVDWSYAPRVDRDDWSAARPGPSKFESMLQSAEALAVFEAVGIFRGIVAENTIAWVQPEQAGGFAVKLNDESLGVFPSMHKSLCAIWDRAGLKHTPDPYAQDDFELAAFLASIGDESGENNPSGQPAKSVNRSIETDDIPF